MDMRVTRARKVFGNGKHNAFTGIAAAPAGVLIVFRSAASHVSPDGVIEVITSRDTETWRVVAELRRPGVDLRDPKVAAFGGKVLVYCGEYRPDAPCQSLVFTSADGIDFGDAMPLRGVPGGRWLWHVRQQGDRLYGSAYWERGGDCGAYLYASDDGLAWQEVSVFPVPANEVYLDFDREGVLWALLRDDGRGCIPALCTAEPPYSRFRSVMHLPMRLQGPMLARLEGGCALVCRQWDQPGRRNLRTELFWLEDGGEIQRVATLPSGGDTSYAGWLDMAPGRAVVSYYSAHEHKMDEPHANDALFAEDPAHAEHSTPADIFLADISYA